MFNNLLFNKLFINYFYKIKLIALATNSIEKIFILDIHNEIYILENSCDDFLFKKIDSCVELNKKLRYYYDFRIGKKEIIRKKIEKKDEFCIYKSNIFSIDKRKLIKMYSTTPLRKKVTKEKFISFIIEKIDEKKYNKKSHF